MSAGDLRVANERYGGRVVVVGGAGFIGSHVVTALLSEPSTARVTVYDNFSSGHDWHLAPHRRDACLVVVRGDVKDEDALRAALDDHDVIVHLASNPDIARAAVEPSIDFYEGTLLTHNVLEAMRMTSARRILYASGSGIYGDLGTTEANEDYGPLIPVSTYGASKLAGEALIAAYCHMYDMSACVFRFGNVVGSRQTHGVGFDFVRRLREDPTRLAIMGDGLQSKSYIHVNDVVAGAMAAHAVAPGPVDAYNVATGDYITVREIADLAVEVVGLEPGSVRFEYGGGSRGWKGDIPVFRLNTDRIRALGWSHSMGSLDAMRAAMLAMLEEIEPTA